MLWIGYRRLYASSEHSNRGGIDIRGETYLLKYPLGYVIFEADRVTGAVTPFETRAGFESYQFDFRAVRVAQTSPGRIELHLPDVFKDGQQIVRAAGVAGPQQTGPFGLVGFGTYGQEGIGEGAEILAINGSRITFLVGFRTVEPPPKNK
jgi:hypothetical protein